MAQVKVFAHVIVTIFFSHVVLNVPWVVQWILRICIVSSTLPQKKPPVFQSGHGPAVGVVVAEMAAVISSSSISFEMDYFDQDLLSAISECLSLATWVVLEGYCNWSRKLPKLGCLLSRVSGTRTNPDWWWWWQLSTMHRIMELRMMNPMM